MKMLRNIAMVALLGVFLGCGTSQKVIEPNQKLDRMMAQKSFKIKIRAAEPQVTQALSQVANSGMIPPGNTVGRIDVSGNGNFIKVQGDSVSADLPFYGERRMGGGYNSDAGIKFNGLAKNLKVTKDETKQRYLVKFSIDSNSENFMVTVNVGSNLISTATVQSSHRNRIRYSGTLEELKTNDGASK